MTDQLNRAAQYGIPALQQRKRDHETFSPPPPATQMWMCPNCERIHYNVPIIQQTYRCICSWHGDRHELCRGDLSCLTTT